jgi:hypothetical protein
MVADKMLSRGLYTNSHFRNNLYLSPSNAPGTAGFPEAGNGVTADYNAYDRDTWFLTSTLDGFAPIMDKSRNPYWPLKKYPPRDTDRIFESFEAFREATGLEAHGVLLDHSVFRDVDPYDKVRRWRDAAPTFRASEFDFRLVPDGAAVDSGARIPGVNDQFKGEAPDMGALESGIPAPTYGPRDKGLQKRWREHFEALEDTQ